MADTVSAPVVRAFISYSLDCADHEAKVFRFADRLRADGVDAIVDKYEDAPPEGWPAWMERNIAEANFVLMICTSTYRRRVENKEEPSKGHGVLWEATIIYNLLYAAKMKNTKFIPVLFAGSTAADVPVPLVGFTRFDVSTEDGYADLWAYLTNKPKYEKRPVERPRILPPKQMSEESLPGAFSLERLSKTMSNPKYADDIYRLDRLWRRAAVIDRETIIIVVGTNIISELLDRSAAELLRDNIDQRGAPYPFRRGVVVTHEGWYGEAEFIKDNPVISIGGPKTNKLTDEFDKWVQPPGERDPKYPIPGPGDRKGFFRKNSVGRPQIGLWGKTANDTRQAVEHYLNDGRGLSEFLALCWK